MNEKFPKENFFQQNFRIENDNCFILERIIERWHQWRCNREARGALQMKSNYLLYDNLLSL